MGSIRAAGLSLITLLAIVPLLALITALGRAFGYGEWLKDEIRHYGESQSLHPAAGRGQTDPGDGGKRRTSARSA